MKEVTVRWFDAYKETFKEVSEVRIGCDLLFIEFKEGKNRHIPLRQVRWVEIQPKT